MLFLCAIDELLEPMMAVAATGTGRSTAANRAMMGEAAAAPASDLRLVVHVPALGGIVDLHMSSRKCF